MSNPDIPRAEWDFSYLEQHEELKRAAVFYEYARHNDELCTWIEYLRSVNVFDPDLKSSPSEARKAIAHRMSREDKFISLDELFFLGIASDFPKYPYLYAVQNEITRDLSASVDGKSISGGRARLPGLSLSEWDRVKALMTDEVMELRGEAIHVMAIPWKEVSNNDLLELFRTWLVRHRPLRFPNPPTLKGRDTGPSADANTKLNQLAAYRFGKFGITREQAKEAGFKLYVSKQKWGEAVKAAQIRIAGMYKASGEA